MSPLLALQDISLRYTSGPPWARTFVEAIRNVTLSIEPGRTLGLVGESGSGKSSLAAVSLAAITPTGGQVVYANQLLTGRARRRVRGELQVVLQNPEWSLNPRLKCEVSVGEPVAIKGDATRRERRMLVVEMLERVGLRSSIAQRFPHELSGGQQQRVAIARALITAPRFIAFDEAVSALDVSTQAQILNLILDLQQERKFSSLFISHDLAAVRYVADEIAVMYAGEVVELAPAASFYGQTGHPYTRALQAASLGGKTSLQLADNGETNVDGCALSPRCPLAIARCRTEAPKLRSVGATLTACHRAEDLPREAPSS